MRADMRAMCHESGPLLFCVCFSCLCVWSLVRLFVSSHSPPFFFVHPLLCILCFLLQRFSSIHPSIHRIRWLACTHCHGHTSAFPFCQGGEMRGRRLGVVRKSPSPVPPLFLAADNVETMSNVVFMEPPFMQQGVNTSCAQPLRSNEVKRTLETGSRSCHRPRSRRICRSGSTVWCLGEKGSTDTDQRGPFLPWHRLEKECEEAAAQMLQKSRYGGWLTNEFSGNGEGSRNKRQRSQSETLIEMESSDMEKTVGGDSELQENDAVDTRFLPAPQLTLSTRPPSVDLHVSQELPVADAPGETLVEAEYPSCTGSKTNSTTTMRLTPPPACLNVPETNEEKHADQMKQEKEIAPQAIRHSRNICTTSTPPLYIFIPPRSSVAEDDSRNISFGQSHVECNMVVNGESTPISYGACVRPHDAPPRSIQSASTTPPKPETLKLSPAVQPKKRMIVTPPRPTNEPMPADFKGTLNPDDSASTDTSAVWRKFHECQSFHASQTDFVSNVNSPRRREAIIGSWHGLSAHCKRAGLKTPPVPLLLRRCEGTPWSTGAL